jgi:hypothetical protein
MRDQQLALTPIPNSANPWSAGSATDVTVSVSTPPRTEHFAVTRPDGSTRAIVVSLRRKVTAVDTPESASTIATARA